MPCGGSPIGGLSPSAPAPDRYRTACSSTRSRDLVDVPTCLRSRLSPGGAARTAPQQLVQESGATIRCSSAVVVPCSRRQFTPNEALFDRPLQLVRTTRCSLVRWAPKPLAFLILSALVLVRRSISCIEIPASSSAACWRHHRAVHQNGQRPSRPGTQARGHPATRSTDGTQGRNARISSPRSPKTANRRWSCGRGSKVSTVTDQMSGIEVFGKIGATLSRLDRPPIAVYRCPQLLGVTAAPSDQRERSIGPPRHVVSVTSSFVRVITRASSLESEVGGPDEVVPRTWRLEGGRRPVFGTVGSTDPGARARRHREGR